MDEPRWPYLLFLTGVVSATALSLLLPGILKVPQAASEEWVMMALLPVTITVVWALRKRSASSFARSSSTVSTRL